MVTPRTHTPRLFFLVGVSFGGTPNWDVDVRLARWLEGNMASSTDAATPESPNDLVGLPMVSGPVLPDGMS